jgi:Protein of unknown function (DUF4239)
MSDWLHNLPVVWMTVVAFGGTYLVAAVIYAIVMGFTSGERAIAFKGVSPGMLPPLGILFGLFVAFTAAQVWTDTDRATAAISHEAGGLSTVLFLAASFPGEPEARVRSLIQSYIQEAITREWPRMARQNASQRITPDALAEALKLVLSLTPDGQGQATAQREIVAALEHALDSRRQRIIISRSAVDLVKWSCMFVQAIAMLIAIAMVHSDNRRAAAIAMGLFAAGVAAAVLIILAHDRPFTGQISPDPLLQVMPEIEAGPQ